MVPILCPVAGISGNEFIVLILVAVIVVGPQRLPEYTRKLTQLIRQLRVFLDNAKTQIAEEVGPELGDLNLADLDPRNYDPRKIVRDALGEDLDAIRRDLTTPIKAVTDAAKESSQEAVRSVTDVVRKERTDTPSKRIEGIEDKIEDKAVQGRQSTLPANNEPDGPEDAKTPESESQTGPNESSAPDHAQDPQEGAAAGSPQEGAAAEGGRLKDGPAGAEGDSAGRSSEPVEASAGDGDHDSAKAANEPDEPAAGGKSADGEPTDAAAVAAASSAAAAAVPSSLTKAPAASDAALTRPVSPREIVRAANAAARTRAEAATVTVDA